MGGVDGVRKKITERTSKEEKGELSTRIHTFSTAVETNNENFLDSLLRHEGMTAEKKDNGLIGSHHGLDPQSS